MKPQADFLFPFPYAKKNGVKTPVVSVIFDTEDDIEGRKIRMRFLDMMGTSSNMELITDTHNAIILSKFLSENTPNATVFGKSEFCTIMETPNRNLYFMLSEKGAELLKEEHDTSFITDGVLGNKFVIHPHQTHPTIPPPTVTLQWQNSKGETSERMWYFRKSVTHGTTAFRDELLKNNWANMVEYRK